MTLEETDVQWLMKSARSTLVVGFELIMVGWFSEESCWFLFANCCFHDLRLSVQNLRMLRQTRSVDSTMGEHWRKGMHKQQIIRCGTLNYSANSL